MLRETSRHALDRKVAKLAQSSALNVRMWPVSSAVFQVVVDCSRNALISPHAVINLCV